MEPNVFAPILRTIKRHPRIINMGISASSNISVRPRTVHWIVGWQLWIWNLFDLSVFLRWVKDLRDLTQKVLSK